MEVRVAPEKMEMNKKKDCVAWKLCLSLLNEIIFLHIFITERSTSEKKMSLH